MLFGTTHALSNPGQTGKQKFDYFLTARTDNAKFDFVFKVFQSVEIRNKL